MKTIQTKMCLNFEKKRYRWILWEKEEEENRVEIKGCWKYEGILIS